MNRWFLAFCAYAHLVQIVFIFKYKLSFWLSHFSFQNSMFQMNHSRNVLLFIQFSFYSYNCSFTQEIKHHWTSKGSEQHVELLVYCRKMQKPLYPFILSVFSAACLLANVYSQDKSISLPCVTLFHGGEWSDLNSRSHLYHVCPCEIIVHYLFCRKLGGNHDSFWMVEEGKWLICHLKPCKAS